MAFVERRITRTSQPQELVGIDRAKVKDTGTKWVSIFNQRGSIKELISGALLTNAGGHSAAQGGQIATFNGAQGSVAPFTTELGSGVNTIVAARVRATATQVGTPGAAFGLYLGSAQYGWGVGFDPANNIGAARLDGGGAYLVCPKATTLGKWHTVFIQAAFTTNMVLRVWVDGVRVGDSALFASAGSGIQLNQAAIGAQFRSLGYLRWLKGDIEWASIMHLPGAIDAFTFTDEMAARLYGEGYPYSLIEPEVQRIWIDDATTAAPPGDPTGTLNATESGSDSATLSGQVVVQGALAATEVGTDTAAISGSSAVTITGSLAATETGTDSAASTGAVLIQGSLAATEVGNDTAVINGSSTIITTGSVNASEAGSDTVSMTGQVLVQALIDAAEAGADTGSMVGQIVVSGVLAASEVGGDTASILQSAPTGVYPDPASVLAGVSYGPTGADYTGTATAGASAAEIAAAVYALSQATPLWTDVRRMNGAVVTGTGVESDMWRGA